MARKPPVLLKMRVATATKSLVATVHRQSKMPPHVFVEEVVDFYELLMVNWRAGTRFGAFSEDQAVCIPNLLLTAMDGTPRRVALRIWGPRTLRDRCQRLARWSGTDDIGLMFEKAACIYCGCATPKGEHWQFFAASSGRRPVPVRLVIK